MNSNDSLITISTVDEKRFVIKNLRMVIHSQFIENVLDLYNSWLRVVGQDESNPDVFIYQIRHIIVGEISSDVVPWNDFVDEVRFLLVDWQNSNGKAYADANLFMEQIKEIFDVQTIFLATKGIAVLPVRG